MRQEKSMTEKEFKALSPERRRVEIAQDVIAQLNAECIIPSHGTYVAVTAETLDKPLQEQKCEVCAIGAVFKSMVDKTKTACIRYNDESPASNEGKNKLETYFSKTQLILMESAFEGFSYFTDRDEYYMVDGWGTADALPYYNLTPADIDTAVEFGEKFGSSKEKIRGIMTNIINNNGTFKP